MRTGEQQLSREMYKQGDESRGGGGGGGGEEEDEEEEGKEEEEEEEERERERESERVSALFQGCPYRGIPLYLHTSGAVHLIGICLVPDETI